MIRVAAVEESSCSQTRMTALPVASSRPVVSRSRSLLLAILAVQNSRRVFGTTKCSLQPCQKHPSTKTYSPTRVNTMSARRRRSNGSGTSTRNRSPAEWRARRNAISGPVSRERFARIVAAAAGETGGTLAEDAVPVGPSR